MIRKTIRRTVNTACLLSVCSLASPVAAAPLLTEQFDDVAALTSRGWTLVNSSTNPGQSWFQGNDAVFPAATGGASSYVAANFESTGDLGGAISNWLLLPAVRLGSTPSITFLTRAEAGVPFPDRLEVRFSANGQSADVGTDAGSVGDFTTLLGTINPALQVSGYPEAWTQFTWALTGFDPDTVGRFAFRYAVPDSTAFGNYVGIDAVVVDAPEPAMSWLAALSALALAGRCRRRPSRRRLPAAAVVLTGAGLLAGSATVAPAQEAIPRLHADSPARQSSSAPTVLMVTPDDAAVVSRRRPDVASASAGALRAYRDPVTGQWRAPEHDERLTERAGARRRPRVMPRQFAGPRGAIGVAVPEHLRAFSVATRRADGRLEVAHQQVPPPARPAGTPRQRREGERHDR